MASLAVLPAVALGATTSGPAPVSSPNWSGYVVFGTAVDTMQLVATDVIVPKVRCRIGETADTSLWDGIGGYNAQHSLAQVGVDAYCEDGRPGYDAWYEWYDEKKKNPAHLVPGVSVYPGDEIGLRVREVNATHYLATMSEWNPRNDHRTGSFRATLTDAHGFPIGNSAECIVESPAKVKGGFYPLASFGAATFSPCEASSQQTFEHEVVDVVTGQGYNVTSSHTLVPSVLLHSDRVDLVRSHVLRAAAGPPHLGTARHPLASFTVFWKHL
jgi:hypothetical protein